MLISNFKIGQLELRNLKPGEDNLNNYLDWMKNEKNNFIESVRPSWNLQELSNFVEKCNSSDSCVLLGIFEGATHIGNIKIDQIDSGSKSAWIGILIGSFAHRGIGIGNAVISQVTKKFYENLQIENFFLGVDKQNIVAIKSYKKSGFSYFRDHEKLDAIIMHKKEGRLLA